MRENTINGNTKISCTRREWEKKKRRTQQWATRLHAWVFSRQQPPPNSSIRHWYVIWVNERRGICVREGVKASLREALRLASTGRLCDALSSLPDSYQDRNLFRLNVGEVTDCLLIVLWVVSRGSSRSWLVSAPGFMHLSQISLLLVTTQKLTDNLTRRIKFDVYFCFDAGRRVQESDEKNKQMMHLAWSQMKFN